jgi:small subunit ribosomal protein S11
MSALIRAISFRTLIAAKFKSNTFFLSTISSSSSVPTTSPPVPLNSPSPIKIATSSRVPLVSSSSSTTATSSSSTSSSSTSSSNQVDSIVHVNCTMNNIVVSVSTLDGEVISRCSGGMIGLKHRARASASAATDIAKNAAQKAVEKGFKVTEVRLKGPSRSRGQILRGIQGAGMKISEIRDLTPMPTNGCRPPAARRL